MWDDRQKGLNLGRCVGFLWVLLVLVSCSFSEDGAREIRVAMRSAPGAATKSELTQLPDAWNHIGRHGTWDYEVNFDVQQRATGESWALYIPRAGNRLAVALNGHHLVQFGMFGDLRANFVQRPHIVFFPTDLLHAGDNRLSIRIEGEAGRSGGLSALYVGPVRTIESRYLLRQAAETWGSFAVIVLAGAMALISGAFALSTKDRAFGLFALACTFCAVRMCYAVVSYAPVDHRWWRVITDAALTGYAISLCKFSVEALGMECRRHQLNLYMAGLSILLVPWGAFSGNTLYRQMWLLALVVYSGIFAAWIGRHWWRHRDRRSRVVAGAALVAVTMAAIDHVLVFYVKDGFGLFTLSRYSLPAYLIAMAWLLVDRYKAITHREAQAKALALVQLAQQKHELEFEFENQRMAALHLAQQQERRRILQDIHDGVGLQLNGLLSMVPADGPQSVALSREVRTAIEQMRLLVHNAESFEGDVSMLMGQIRYFVEHRLNQAGIALTWQVKLNAPGRVVPPDHALALQRLVFELVTNVLKHAEAGHVAVDVDDLDGRVPATLRVTFEDDGVGFDLNQPPRGRGAASIRQRVTDLTGRFELQSTLGAGTRYVLHFGPALFETSQR